MTWRKQRQILYVGTGLLIFFGIVFYGIFSYISAPGSCRDGVQDDGELGIDCGGPCARLCTFQVQDPVVEWARALPLASSTYTAVAYVRNPQAGLGAAAYDVGYTFRLLGPDNHLVIEQTGVTDLPAVETIPIIEPDIPTGSLPVARVQLSFTTQPIVWTKIPKSARPTLTVKDAVLASDGSRLSATIVNETNAPIRDLALAGVLFDASGNAVAASHSIIKFIPAEGQDEVVFTWPVPNATAVRNEITPLPALPPNPQP